ncbi:MAG: malonyl-ACP O-methyltransferase BioC [Clostridium sp.]
MIDKNQVKLHFSKNAKSYDQYAVVQKNMANALLSQIKISKNTSINILEIGCGTGYLTNMLINYFPSGNITAIDIAEGMINEAKKNTSSININFKCCDIEEVNLNDTYDLIISNATFQWFNNLNSTINKLYRLLNENGVLLFSTFGENTFNELHSSYKKASLELNMPNYSCGQDFLSCNTLKNIILRTTNTKPTINEYTETHYFPSCSEFFKSIKKVGASNSNTSNRCLSPSYLKKVIDIYSSSFNKDNNIYSTYHYLLVSINRK